MNHYAARSETLAAFPVSNFLTRKQRDIDQCKRATTRRFIFDFSKSPKPANTKHLTKDKRATFAGMTNPPGKSLPDPATALQNLPVLQWHRHSCLCALLNGTLVPRRNTTHREESVPPALLTVPFEGA
jgi:hypothetical protein